MKTDDIIKALKCQLGIDDSHSCYGCLFREDKSCINRSERIFEVVKDLINHQKAEIERLKSENGELKLKMSYMKEPNTIGGIHEMGAW